MSNIFTLASFKCSRKLSNWGACKFLDLDTVIIIDTYVKRTNQNPSVCHPKKLSTSPRVHNEFPNSVRPESLSWIIEKQQSAFCFAVLNSAASKMLRTINSEIWNLSFGWKIIQRTSKEFRTKVPFRTRREVAIIEGRLFALFFE